MPEAASELNSQRVAATGQPAAKLSAIRGVGSIPIFSIDNIISYYSEHLEHLTVTEK
jgi:hypothetical protein